MQTRHTRTAICATKMHRRSALTVVGLAIGLALGVGAAEADEPGLKCPLDRAYDDSNPFARIIRGELRGAMIYQDETVLAFVPIDWEHPGHALVIPRRAVRHLGDLSDAEMVAVLHVVRRIAAAQQGAFGATGYTLMQNNGRNQSVCHAHFHIIPNTPAHPRRAATPAEMETVAEALRKALPPS